ncbi:hypothetical protein ACKA04_04590 [Helcococcus kunzii]|uniref:hypothetical protein n=1 Tax=Helcococcus kunzii TaxID=40091 RepID=UPI0038A143D3
MGLKLQINNKHIPMNKEQIKTFINNQTLQGLIANVEHFSLDEEIVNFDGLENVGKLITRLIIYAKQNNIDWEEQLREYIYESKIFED